MSEKRAEMGKTGLRFTAIVPIATMAIAFALTLVALLAGSKQGFMESCNVMTLNTTDIGQNIIKFAPVTKAKRGIVARVNGSALEDGELDERGLFSSSATTTSAAPGVTATAASGGPFEAIGNFFNGVVQNLTSAVDGALTDAENALVAEVAKELGIAQYYTMHMTTLCQGNLSSPTDPNAQFKSTSCESYSNVTAGLSNFTSGIPSSLQVATTNVSVPLLSQLSSSGSVLKTAGNALGTATFAFYILALIGSSMTLLLSLVSIFTRSISYVTYACLIFSILAAVFQLVANILVTVLAGGTMLVVNTVGSSIGLQSKMGMRFQAIIWVAFVMTLLGMGYWVAIWFVEYRTRSYKARTRTPAQIGNWWGIIPEVLSDLRKPAAGDELPQGWSSQVHIGNPKPIRARSYAMI
ncbi:hypothetical protein BP6252_12544 [Coleophoma cylindrospora]|uniref:Sur7 protein n=1 Tax=Coleophoma cylindrospora TaxID=1849047 RepID=A0A3D8QCL2_9HELO|nr:hypothetical protein BP6252_12544 [Coleophoma cylindrospora]